MRAICTRQRPCSPYPCRRPPSPPSRTAPGMRHAPTDAGRIAARRAPGRSMPPAPACRSAPAPALALRPLTARHAACKWRVAIVATASRLPGYAVPSGTTPAACAPGFLSPATAAPPAPPSGACGSPLATACPPGPPAPLRAPAAKPVRGGGKLHNEELSAACRLSGSRPDNFRYAKCRPSVTRPRPPWLSGCAASHCVARFRLARLPPVRPRRWLPKSRRWCDGDLWISGLFSPSMHHECRSPGTYRHKTTKNQSIPLSDCRIYYLLLTFSQGIASLLPFSKRGRQWHISRSASTAMALPRTGC